MTARAVPERVGRPIVGVDLGGGRAWAPPSLCGHPAELKRGPLLLVSLTWWNKSGEIVSPRELTQNCMTWASLEIAEGLRVQPPAQLWDMIRETWGRPQVIICDRFRLAELQDAIGNKARIEPRVSRWSEASFDIRSLRKISLDGPLAVDEGSRALIATSLARAMVRSDDQGNTRIVKKGTNTSRDDVAAALVLACGALARKPKTSGVRSLGLA